MIDIIVLLDFLSKTGWLVLGIASLSLCFLVWTDKNKPIYIAAAVVAITTISMAVMYIVKSMIMQGRL